MNRMPASSKARRRAVCSAFDDRYGAHLVRLYAALRRLLRVPAPNVAALAERVVVTWTTRSLPSPAASAVSPPSRATRGGWRL
jgi:hypothetical protein